MKLVHFKLATFCALLPISHANYLYAETAARVAGEKGSAESALAADQESEGFIDIDKLEKEGQEQFSHSGKNPTQQLDEIAKRQKAISASLKDKNVRFTKEKAEHLYKLQGVLKDFQAAKVKDLEFADHLRSQNRSLVKQIGNLEKKMVKRAEKEKRVAEKKQIKMEQQKIDEAIAKLKEVKKNSSARRGRHIDQAAAARALVNATDELSTMKHGSYATPRSEDGLSNKSRSSSIGSDAKPSEKPEGSAADMFD